LSDAVELGSPRNFNTRAEEKNPVGSGLKAVLLIMLILVPAFAVVQTLPVAKAQGQTQNETEDEFVNLLSTNHYNYTAISVTEPSIVGYATKSNVSIYTAFMDQQQLEAFTAPSDIANAIFYQGGLVSYDALLAAPGTYYLVIYSPSAPANVTELYTIDPNIDLHNATTNVGEFITIQPGSTFTIPLHVETLGSSSQVDILGASSQIVQYTVFDNTTQTAVYTSPDVTITNFTGSPTVSAGYNLTLVRGFYILAIQDASPDPAYVYFQYTVTPAYVNPFILNFGPPSPTGIAAYGIDNESGNVVPYKVVTNAVVGFAQVNALTALDNKSGTHQASLQLNTVLQVNNTDGSLFTYWPQNVLAFVTNASSVTYRDNVLNTTGDGAQLTNQTIQGVGITTGDDNDGVMQTYYGNYASNYTYTYSYPQTWILYMNESIVQGHGVLIQMGVRALDGANSGKITWYDKIMIVDPNVANAGFVVDGRAYTPAGAATFIGSYYDAELVFGGGAGGQAATLSALNARLALFYSDNGTLAPYPSLYTFGDDTAEAVYNVRVSSADGYASLQPGTPTYSLLTNDFNASFATLLSEAKRPAALSLSSPLVLGAVAVVVLVVVALAVFSRRHRPSQVATVQPQAVTAPAASFCRNCGAKIEPGEAFCGICGTPTGQQPGQSI
jgi:thermopsin